jgi:hypothetical protein
MNYNTQQVFWGGLRAQAVNPGANFVTENSKVSSEELVIFARFHAIRGKEEAVTAELRDAVARVRVEPGCMSIQALPLPTRPASVLALRSLDQ